MARIRTIKPEFWTDATLGECSTTARLLFLGALTHADDYGNLDRNARQLRAQVFPYDPIECEPLLLELLLHGLLVEYLVEGKTFLHIKGFLNHQRIDKPSKPRVPLYEPSLTTPRILDEPSALYLEGKGTVRELEQDTREPSRKMTRSRRASTNGSASSGLSRGGNTHVATCSPTGLDQTAWLRWVEYRRGIGKPIKPPSFEAAQKALAGFGDEQAQVVEQSVANGWQGLFALKAAASGSKIRPRTVAELEAQEQANHADK